MPRPYRIGLTGGVGSGKSTVAGLFAGLGAQIIDTDDIAHNLTRPGGAAMPAISARFGPGVTNGEGALDRANMRSLIFTYPDQRKALEAILHPMIRHGVEQSVQRSTRPYVLIVVPLLVENLAAYRNVIDRILVVDCDEDQQLVRTAARPGLDLGEAKAIIAAQATRTSRLALADDVIRNDAGLAELEPQVLRLHRIYLDLGAECP